MERESTTFGLSPEKLARLLNIGSDASQAEDKVGPEQKKAELLHDWLAATLPADAALVESLPKIVGRLCRRLLPLVGEPFGNLLQNPKTDVAVIKKIKDYSKKMVASARSETEHDAATAIYYAAIASALVFHDKRITKFSYQSLKNSFSTLVESSWLTSEITDLFRKACRLWEQKLKHKAKETTR
jgi:hypothetical protein